jgi:uncharacterized protein (DUF433 family)
MIAAVLAFSAISACVVQSDVPRILRTETVRDLVFHGKFDLLKEYLAAFRKQWPDSDPDLYSDLMPFVETGFVYGNALTGVRMLHEAGFVSHTKQPYTLNAAIRYDCDGKMVARLIEYGADPKKAWIGLAVQNERPKILRLLIDKGADLNLEARLDNFPTNNEQMRTALQYAARYGRTESLKILIAAKADLNAQNSVTRRTALHEAVVGNQVDAVRRLLKAGAKTTLKDGEGRTPLQVAVRLERTDLARLLRGRRG